MKRARDLATLVALSAVVVTMLLVAWHYSPSPWHFLDLLVVPTVLAAGGYIYRRLQRAAELEIEEQRAMDNRLEAYLRDMSEYILAADLGKPDADLEVCNLARARTITTLANLDGKRKGEIVRFLHESGLITRVGRSPIIRLHRADLRGVDLRDAKLEWVDLREVDLRGAQLQRANLRRACIGNANLSAAVLSGADLFRCDLRGADMSHADLSEDASGRRTNLVQANLQQANLQGASLARAIFSGADLRTADLRKANLSNADLTGADLRDANTSGANMDGAARKWAHT